METKFSKNGLNLFLTKKQMAEAAFRLTMNYIDRYYLPICISLYLPNMHVHPYSILICYKSNETVWWVSW